MIQLCIVLYADRVNCWTRLNRELRKPDDEVDAALVVEMNVRNKLAFDELQCFQKNQTFLWKHPILEKKKLGNELFELKKSNPKKFLKEYAACQMNIKQYNIKLRRKTNTEIEVERFTDNLQYYEMKYEAFLDILNKK